MDPIYIDINADVGEGIANEPKFFPFISSCNIACGGHTGTRETMKETVRLARTNQVSVGAHPSYPDKENFGRVTMKMGERELTDSIREQIDHLMGICRKEGVTLKHIKPHGALYNDLARDSSLAALFLEIMAEYTSDLALFVPYGSVIHGLAEKQGLRVIREAFADRNYNNDLSLVSRCLPNALIEEPLHVLRHVVRMAREKRVLTAFQEFKGIHADTFCIHGDTDSALQILMYITEELPKHNIFLSK